VFATIPVAVNFIMSSLVANGVVICLQFLFRESGDKRGDSFDGMIWVITEIEDGFSFCVEYSSGHIFYGNCGLHHRGQESVHEGGSHQQGSGEGRVLFLLGLF